jgi:hypothetical protein
MPLLLFVVCCLFNCFSCSSDAHRLTSLWQARSHSSESAQIAAVREDCDRKLAALRETHAREQQLQRDELHAAQQHSSRLTVDKAELAQQLTECKAELQAARREMTGDSELRVRCARSVFVLHRGFVVIAEFCFPLFVMVCQARIQELESQLIASKAAAMSQLREHEDALRKARDSTRDEITSASRQWSQTVEDLKRQLETARSEQV